MKEKQINILIGIFYFISAIMVLAGAYFRLQQDQDGLSLMITGFMSGTVTSTYETYRLRKKIKKLEDQINQKPDKQGTD